MKLLSLSLGRTSQVGQRGRFWLAGLHFGVVSPVFASSEADRVLPNLKDVAIESFMGGMSSWNLLAYGLIVCVEGLAFGAVVYGLSLIHI